MTTTRENVLRTLLTRQRCTINELADAVGINPISVRHHVTKLEAEGFVTSEEERHGVGRPRRVYFLTEEGMEKFPTRYLRLTVRLLQQLKETLPEPMVDKLFTQVANDLVKDYTSDLQLDGVSMEERTNFGVILPDVIIGTVDFSNVITVILKIPFHRKSFTSEQILYDIQAFFHGDSI